MSSMRLFVGSDGRVDALKCLAVADLSSTALKVLPMSYEMNLLGANVVLDASASAAGAPLVCGAQPIVRFLTEQSAGELSAAADDLLEWDANVFGPASAVLANTAARARSALPLTSDMINADLKRAEAEAAAASAAAAAAAAEPAAEAAAEPAAEAEGKGKGKGKGGKKGKKGAAPVETRLAADIASAARAFLAGLDRIIASTPDKVSATTACLALSAQAPFKAGVFPDDVAPAARDWTAKVVASPAVAKALASDEAVVAAAAVSASAAIRIPQARDELLSALRDAFGVAVNTAFPSLRDISPEAARPVVRLPGGPKFPHDAQCDNAMSAYSALSRAGQLPAGVRSPRDVGVAIAAALPPNGMIARTEVAGPGFINIFVNDGLLTSRCASILKEGLQAPPRRPRHVAIDYSSPNIAKDMHVGHLRSTIIGDAISRILEYAGHRISRINHVGDWGTQFGMLLAHLKDTFPDYETRTPDISNLTVLYKEAKVRFDDKSDPEFKQRAYKEVVALQAGDEVNLRLWRTMVEVSAAMFNDVYKRLGVHPGLYLCGESFYNPLIPSTIEELSSKGLLTEDEGALLMFIEGEKVPLMVRKSDGGYGYDSTDLAAIRYRIQDLKADWLVYVIDAGQALHLRLTFKAAEVAGWADPAKHRIDHVSFGIVCGEDKKRFRTRSGETVRLVDLLDQAKAIMIERLQDRKEGAEAAAADDSTPGHAAAASASVITDAAEIEATAEGMGYGAVKYFDLKQNRLSDYIFNYDRMLSSDGDTAVYLQYQFARMHSILRKAAEKGHDVDGAVAAAAITITHPSEHKLLFQLASWADAVAEAEDSLNPHVLCKWLYETSTYYAEFQRDCRVIGDENFASRVAIVAATVAAVKTAMEVIGIPPVNRL
ncbi:hypothetical protein FNF29_01105 [Cafeteria roenbergensis]|uniref:arginine--tRNA ligase n=2 Tax=Cafeteria roenbergensis TaxID=33653 RepID=A0A5A8CT33_CAFRO|nr:hypothetical protein FNF29_01105 [Cafeteria roenbergensis]|eukprot:KAA0156312.1 hypothetical protein FNF29_01105 [Cafeteria roenbergensis]